MAQKPLKPASRIEIQETDESKNIVATYIASPPEREENKARIDIVIPENTNGFARSILNAFLPAGYPHSVTDDYLEYQIYDSLQAFSSSIAGMLSSRAVLEGIGVGDSHASPTQALLLSVLQESMGRIATILFAHRLGTSLEPECKTYRLLADIFNDSAMILDCLSPALPKPSRVALLALSSCLRSLCGVAAGSSKASLSAHFATQGNLGELNAKDSSQETIISLLGMLAGSLVVSHIRTKLLTWTTLIFLLAIHLGTNYLAVRAVSMRTLNRQRANIVFSNCLDDAFRRLVIPTAPKDKSPLRVPTPKEVSLRERIFEKDGVLRWNGRSFRMRPSGNCRIGAPISELLACFDQPSQIDGRPKAPPLSDFPKLLEVFKNDEYLMMWDQSFPIANYVIVLKEGASNTTLLSAWMHALYHAEWWALHRKEEETLIETIARTKAYVEMVQDHYGLWDELVGKGWDVETGALETRSGTRVKILDSR